ncbi:MAG TPA: hypothetical protein VGM81_11260 [Burkholderiaceae bacterium]|jgi:hypothetical protein
MNDMTDLGLMAYVDGELDARARVEFEARLAADPALRESLAREQLLRAALRGAFDPVLNEPVPESLQALLKPPGAEVRDISAARRARIGWAAWGGMAASLLVGLLVGKNVGQQAPQSLMVQGELAQALDQGLSGEQRGNVTLKMSVMAQAGGVCRVFTLAREASAGLACRDDEGWRLRQLAPMPAGSKAEYRTASTELPPELLRQLDAVRVGDALDAQAEQQARARGWRK